MARSGLADRAGPLPLLDIPPDNRHERRAVEARARLAKRTAKHTGRAVTRVAYTIDEFCFAHGFSRAHYYNLKARREAPDEMRALGKILITNEAAARWRKRAAAT
jgi:hypothetical protein